VPAKPRQTPLEKFQEETDKRYSAQVKAPDATAARYDVISTGVWSLDRALIHGGWIRGRIHELVGPPDSGKGHPLGTRIMTPSGWEKLGNLRPGDEASGSDGKPTRISDVYKRGVLPVYRVTFSDGASVRCDGDHLWRVQTPKMKNTSGGSYVKSVRDIASGSLLTSDGRKKWWIPVCSPVWHPQSELPVDSYLAGVLLGNGGFTSRGSLALHWDDRNIIERIERRTGLRASEYNPTTALRFYFPGSPSMIRKLGQEGCKSADKFIPEEYLRASEQDRRDLLAGLMDTDGSVVPISSNSAGNASFSSTSRDLAEGVIEIVRSLGGISRIYENTYGDRENILYEVSVLLPECPFYSPRKAEKWTPPKRGISRAITSVELESEEEVWCIRVEADDSLYITEDYLVTHNTTLMISTAVQAQALKDGRAGYVDMEGTFDDFWAQQNGLDLSRGKWEHQYPMDSEDASDMARKLTGSGLFPLVIVDSVGGMESRKALARDAADDLVGKNAQVISRMVKHLAALAREANTAVILVNQPRSAIGSMGGDVSAGPKAMQHSTTTRVQMARSGGGEGYVQMVLEEGEKPETVSQEFTARITRSKAFPVSRRATFWVNRMDTGEYGPAGINHVHDYAETGIKAKVITQSGSFYTLPGGGKVQGRKAVTERLRDDEKERALVRRLILEASKL
jgi:RecA/RadA recombinase